MKVCLVLEGGGMRAIYTCGVLDFLMENKINIDKIVGVSAGALYGVNYFSKQPHRALRYNKKYCNDSRYMGMKSLLLTGNIVNKDFAFYEMTFKLDPFDNETYKKTNKDFYAVTTNIKTGKPDYFKITDIEKDLEILRASSALPLASKIININGELHMDGGITNSIPIEFAQTLDCDKIIVVLTQDSSYRKESFSPLALKAFKFKYGKYKKMYKALENRHIMYNTQLDLIKELESRKEIFVIRPSESLKISRLEKNPSVLEKTYNIGYADASKNIKKLKEYLKK